MFDDRESGALGPSMKFILYLYIYIYMLDCIYHVSLGIEMINEHDITA